MKVFICVLDFLFGFITSPKYIYIVCIRHCFFFLPVNHRTMGLDEYMTVDGCSCFDLNAGGMIIGCIELAISILLAMSGLSDPLTFYFLLTCLYFPPFSLNI